MAGREYLTLPCRSGDYALNTHPSALDDKGLNTPIRHLTIIQAGNVTQRDPLSMLYFAELALDF